MLIAVIFAVHLAAAAQTPENCTVQDIKLGACVTNSGSDISIEEIIHVGGHQGADSEGGGTEGDRDVDNDAYWYPPMGDSGGMKVGPPLAPGADDCSPDDTRDCYESAPEPDPEPEPATPAEPAVTIRDVATFLPSGPASLGEPNGWGVVGLPVNFVSDAASEVVDGMLFGRPLEVRFTPVAFRWATSDGDVVESAGGGATWGDLGQAEFSDTATSHRFAASGTYRVEHTAVLGAEYRFAGSVWRPIAGTLNISGPPQEVLIGEFDTVLTAGDCNSRPDEPGC